MRVLVFEQWRGGHWFNYLECLLPRLSEIATEVVVAMTRRALDWKILPTNSARVGHLPMCASRVAYQMLTLHYRHANVCNSSYICATPLSTPNQIMCSCPQRTHKI